MAETQYISVSEAATERGITVQAIYKRINAGDVKSETRYGVTVIKRKDLVKFKDKRKTAVRKARNGRAK